MAAVSDKILEIGIDVSLCAVENTNPEGNT